MTEWVDDNNPRTPIKNKWTGLVLDPLTSIYDEVIRNAEEEYEKYADIFSMKEGFEYEIDNTPIYAQPGPEPEPEPEPEDEPVTEPVKEPPPMSEDKKSQLMVAIADIVIKIITILGTLYVTYNLYYNMKKNGETNRLL